MEEQIMFLNECFLQKVNHYDALVVINDDKEKLSLGKELVLEIDNDNDGKEAVFAKLGKAKIGVLSEEDSKIIRKFLKAGIIMFFLRVGLASMMRRQMRINDIVSL